LRRAKNINLCPSKGKISLGKPEEEDMEKSLIKKSSDEKLMAIEIWSILS